MEQKRIFRWKRITAGLGLFLFALLAVLIGIACLAYYSPRPADLPCRGCTGDARSVRVNGFDLYYREAGSNSHNTPVVVVHGGPGHSSQSFKQSFDFLAQNRRVIYYDQRGSGNSQIKPDPSAYTIDQLVEELEAIRRDVIGTDQIVLIGHSAGGALCQRYALKYPQHLESLVLVSSIQINNGVSAPLLWDVFGPAFFVLGAGIPPADPDTGNAWFGQASISSALPRLYDQSRRDLLEDAGEVSFATWREVSRSLEGRDYKDDLRQLPVRSMVMYGAADSGYTGEGNSSTLCSLLPNCRLVRFERSGHWPFLEEPERFAAELNSFLANE